MNKRRRKGRKLLRPPKEQFDYHYYTLNMDVKQMAEMYKVTPHTIYTWAGYYRKEEENKPS